MTKPIIAVLFAITANLMAGEPETITGKLCIDGSPCVERNCGQPIDAPTTERRAFTFTSASVAVLGFVEPGRTTIACTAGSTLELRVNAPALIRPVNARVTIGAWAIDVPVQRKALLVRLPRGEYTLTIEAPHHVTLRDRIRVASEHLAYTAELKAVPRLSGRIVTAKDGVPVAGAVIRTDTTEPVTTDSTGRFVLEIDPDKWPTRVDVDAIGFGTTSAYVPRLRVNTNLDDIRVVPGASIAVQIKGLDSAVEVALEKRLPGRVEGTPYKRLSGAGGTFTGVEPGAYVVLLKGPGPCQRHGTLVDVTAAERKDVTIEVERFVVNVRTSMAGQPLPSASVVLRNHDFHWHGEFKTDSTAEATLELWQGGKSTAWLAEKSAMTVAYRVDRELANGKDTDWVIDVPGREINGVVIDSQSGDPVPHAAVALQVQDVDNGVGVHTRADDNGRFRFIPAPYGRHTLRAASNDHMPGEISYTFVEPEQSRTVTLRLDPTVKVRLTVQDARGVPLANARVLQFRGGAMAGAGVTDAEGILDIPAAKDEVRDVYVLPRDGSLAFLQIRDDQPQVVAVPDGSSRIIIRAESPSHAPAVNASIAMSINGRPVPREVLSAIGAIRGVAMRSGTDGRIVLDRMPPGIYELRAEAADGSRVARFTIGPGDNEASVDVPE